MRTFVPLLVMLLALPAQSQTRVPMAVAQVDVDRYMGQWYEIARLPNHLERDCASDVVSVYERRSESAIRVTYECRHADGEAQHTRGVARIRDMASHAKLELRFAPLALASASPREPDCEPRSGCSFIPDPCPCEFRIAIDFTHCDETQRVFDRGTASLSAAGLSIRVVHAVTWSDADGEKLLGAGRSRGLAPIPRDALRCRAAVDVQAGHDLAFRHHRAPNSSLQRNAIHGSAAAPNIHASATRIERRL